MHFLNDKFFRVAVISFFIFMALPFLFSTPEPEKKNNTASSEFEPLNPVYKIAGRIARFYGFAKEDNKDEFAFKQEQITKIKQQIAENAGKKENTSALNKSALNKKEQENKTANAYNAAAKVKEQAAAKKANQTYQTNTSDIYFNFEIENSPALMTQNKENKNFENSFTSPQNSPKTNKNIADRQTKNIYQNNFTAENYTNASTQLASSDNKNKFSEETTAPQTANKNQSATSLTSQKPSLKNSLNKYFSSSAKPGQDFSESFDTSLKNIQAFKQNQTEEAEQKTPARTHTRIYRAQVYNPKTEKKEDISVQQTFEEQTLTQAQKIKQITAQGIVNKKYSDKTFKYSDGREATFPSREETALLTPGVAPHILLADSNTDTNLNEQFLSSYQAAVQNLPSKATEYPILEFVYKNKGSEVLRAPNNSFNVIALSRILADKVLLPSKQKNIDFLDTKNRIYVVPEENIYQKYLAMHIPVIYYPDLSPANLGRVYETASEAIKTLSLNKKEQTKTEQKQNKTEIEKVLKED